MTIPYDIQVTSEGTGFAAWFEDDVMHSVTHTDPRFEEICIALREGRSPNQVLDKRELLISLDDRVQLREAEILLDGKPIHDNLTDTIIRYHREGRDTSNLVRFMERLELNPSEQSRENLFDWAETLDLTIDPDGYFIGFKGVREDLLSIHAGGAFVDDVWVDGNVPNKPGTFISMERSKVQPDPKVECSFGLHVGTYGYARSFGSIVVLVRVDPADVVSVPSDSGYAKLRCCRYKVISVHEGDRDRVREIEPEKTRDYVEPSMEETFSDVISTGWLAKLKNLRKSLKG